MVCYHQVLTRTGVAAGTDGVSDVTALFFLLGVCSDTMPPFIQSSHNTSQSMSQGERCSQVLLRKLKVTDC